MRELFWLDHPFFAVRSYRIMAVVGAFASWWILSPSYWIPFCCFSQSFKIIWVLVWKFRGYIRLPVQVYPARSAQSHSGLDPFEIFFRFPLKVEAGQAGVFSVDWTAGDMRYQADRVFDVLDGSCRRLEVTEIGTQDAEIYLPMEKFWARTYEACFLRRGEGNCVYIVICYCTSLSDLLRMEVHTERNLARQSNIDPMDGYKGHKDRCYDAHFMAKRGDVSGDLDGK